MLPGGCICNAPHSHLRSSGTQVTNGRRLPVNLSQLCSQKRQSCDASAPRSHGSFPFRSAITRSANQNSPVRQHKPNCQWRLRWISHLQPCTYTGEWCGALVSPCRGCDMQICTPLTSDTSACGCNQETQSIAGLHRPVHLCLTHCDSYCSTASCTTVPLCATCIAMMSVMDV